MLPAPRYSVILADPPWRYDFAGGQGCADNHYSTLGLGDLKALPIGAFSASDSVLLMWATWPMLQEAIELGKAWGFSYKTCAFVWTKLNPNAANRWTTADDPVNWFFGLGFWTRANTEFCLLFTKGNPHRKANDVRQMIIAPKQEHSRKPDEQYDKIERLVDGPYLELFARRKRPGWYAWGNEVDSDVALSFEQVVA
jgi:N6-adenosine-specific RNA methylase IME4